jgi:hypothetical protein
MKILKLETVQRYSRDVEIVYFKKISTNHLISNQ